jgi:hypothetical protein
MGVARKVYGVDQGEGIYVTGQFKDQAGVAIPFSALQTVTLTLYNADDPDETATNTINSRNAQNVKPPSAGQTVNNVTIDANSAFTYDSPGDDHPMKDATRETELHVARFDFTYGTAPIRPGRHEIGFRVHKIRRGG